jgi:hypothetical protein
MFLQSFEALGLSFPAQSGQIRFEPFILTTGKKGDSSRVSISVADCRRLPVPLSLFVSGQHCHDAIFTRSEIATLTRNPNANQTSDFRRSVGLFPALFGDCHFLQPGGTFGATGGLETARGLKTTRGLSGFGPVE